MNSSLTLPSVVTDLHGLHALCIHEYLGLQEVYHRDAISADFRVQLEPRSNLRLLSVTFDRFFLVHARPSSVGLKAVNMEDAAPIVAWWAIAKALTESGSLEHTRKGDYLHVEAVDLTDDWEERQDADDATILRHLAARLYWSHKFRVAPVRITEADQLLLHTPVDHIALVAIAGEGVYWSRTGRE